MKWRGELEKIVIGFYLMFSPTVYLHKVPFSIYIFFPFSSISIFAIVVACAAIFSVKFHDFLFYALKHSFVIA